MGIGVGGVFKVMKPVLLQSGLAVGMPEGEKEVVLLYGMVGRDEVASVVKEVVRGSGTAGESVGLVEALASVVDELAAAATLSEVGLAVYESVSAVVVYERGPD